MKDNSLDIECQGPTTSWVLNYLINLRDSGALSVMPGNTRKILDVLITHRFTDRQRFPLGTKRIMKESGVKDRCTFFRCIRQLEAAGLLGPRVRAPGRFHNINLWDIPLYPVIDVTELKAELNLQKKHRTTVLKNSTIVNENERKAATVLKNHTHTTVLKKHTPTTVLKKHTHKHLNHIRHERKKILKERKRKRTPSSKEYKNSPEACNDVVIKSLKDHDQRLNNKKKRSHSSLDSGEKAFQLLDKELNK